MPYYIRVLGTEDPNIPISVLMEALKADGQTAIIELDASEEPGPWITIDVSDGQGRPLAQIERNSFIINLGNMSQRLGSEKRIDG